MADTIRKMLDITGTMFKDGQAAKSLTPQKFRDVMETMKTQYAFNKYASGTFTTAAATVYKSLDLADTLVANGFSNPANGDMQYDSPPKDSVTGANQPRDILAVAIATVEPVTLGYEAKFAFAVDGTQDTNSEQGVELLTVGAPQQVVVATVLNDVTNGQIITFDVQNVDNTNNMIFDNCVVILWALND